MTLESAVAFALALLVWALIPGPAIFAIVGRSLTAGLKPALKLIVGILLGDFFYMAIVLFGLGTIGKAMENLFFNRGFYLHKVAWLIFKDNPVPNCSYLKTAAQAKFIRTVS